MVKSYCLTRELSLGPTQRELSALPTDQRALTLNFYKRVVDMKPVANQGVFSFLSQPTHIKKLQIRRTDFHSQVKTYLLNKMSCLSTWFSG